MSSAPTAHHLHRLLAAVRRRERLADAAWVLARWALPAGLWIGALCVLGTRVGGWPNALLWACALPVPVALVWAALRRRHLRATARRIDDHYRLGDQLGSALEFRERPPKANDPRTSELAAFFASEAEGLAKGLDARPVVPIRIPGPRLSDLVALVALAAAAWVPEPEADQAKSGPWNVLASEALETGAPGGVDMALAEPLRQNLRALAKEDDAVAKTARRMLEVLDALEAGEMSRADALAELEKLEAALADAEQALEVDLEEDPGMLADTVRDLADALQEHEITEEAGDAFEQATPEDAEAAMREAAEEAEASAESAEAMRQAMEDLDKKLAEAAKKQSKQSEETDKALDEAERRLRKENKKKEPTDPEDKERRLQKKKKLEERVEQLRRQQKREQEAQRRLDELRRQAKQAGKKGQSGQSRRDAMQKLSRSASEAARKSRGARRSQQARDGMQEAKSFVRRAGKQGEGANRRRQQFKRFSKAAKGKQGKDGKGKDGKGGKNKSSLLVEGKVGDGQPSAMMDGEGQGQGEGEGQGQGEGDSDGQGQGDSDGQGQGQGQGDGQGQGQGDGMGDGSVDPLGEDSSMLSRKRTVKVRAKEGGGVSRAEVIRDSSQQGFATESYRDVFTDYRGFAQSALDNEALPAARRRAIRRYYQLIQPRE